MYINSLKSVTRIINKFRKFTSCDLSDYVRVAGPGGRRALLRVGWNRQDQNYMATFALEAPNDAHELIVIDMRVPCTPVARLRNHRAPLNGFSWYSVHVLLLLPIIQSLFIRFIFLQLIRNVSLLFSTCTRITFKLLVNPLSCFAYSLNFSYAQFLDFCRAPHSSVHLCTAGDDHQVCCSLQQSIDCCFIA